MTIWRYVRRKKAKTGKCQENIPLFLIKDSCEKVDLNEW